MTKSSANIIRILFFKHVLIFKSASSRYLFGISCFIIAVIHTGCQKLIDVDPPVTSITGESVFNSDATAISVLTGLYANMSGESAAAGVSFLTGLSADELTLWSGITNRSQMAFYTNSLYTNPSSSAGPEFWSKYYSYIFTCNAAIEGLNDSKNLNPAVQQQLLGEAKFMRALFYFYIVNLYGDAPLILSTDYRSNAVLSRSTTDVIYKKIIADLKDAKNLLSSNYLDISLRNTTNDRVRPTKWAAIALLARAYLYTKDWVNAEAEASAVTNSNGGSYSLSPLKDVFLANSNEAIWQLQPVTIGYVTNTWDGKLFIIPSTGPNDDQPAFLSNFLLNSFEVNDHRRIEWIDSTIAGGDTFYYPHKYKINAPNAPVEEYLMMLRLGEQYLIRAEARAQQGNISGAQTDLNMIRNRAGLANTLSNNKISLLAEIFHERQVELFTESGHRWLDIKRNGTVDNLMSEVTPQKGGHWSKNWQWYPIPFSDIQQDRNLVQNIGY